MKPERITESFDPSEYAEANFNGYFRSDYELREKTVIDIAKGSATTGTLPPIKCAIRDGRKLQACETDHRPNFESHFFDNHSFVLLPHTSRVNNWDSGAFEQSDTVQSGDRSVVASTGENEIETHYMQEIEDLIRNVLLPGRNLSIDQPNMVLRRGSRTAHPYYGLSVHNDYGVTADDFQENLESFSTPEAANQWRNQFESDEVQEFLIINFWRPVHMLGPVEHMPLAVLDSRSVDLEDLVPSGLANFTLTGKITNQLSLRYNGNQAWYCYPRMTVDEVLALRLFHIDKDTAEYEFGACYHSAFENPLAPENAEERQSCEHRVNVFIYRD